MSATFGFVKKFVSALSNSVQTPAGENGRRETVRGAEDLHSHFPRPRFPHSLTVVGWVNHGILTPTEPEARRLGDFTCYSMT